MANVGPLPTERDQALVPLVTGDTVPLSVVQVC